MHDHVKQYYGETLSSSEDLQTNACCTDSALPAFVKPILAEIHDEVLTRYYGCGLILPELLNGLTILDLGCGAGRDVYVLSKLVGETGTVLGVDMTEQQLEVAQKYTEYHQQKFGYSRSNVQFFHGYIERLNKLEINDNSVDIIVSNCVINLSPDKNAVLKEAFRVLKPGGELYFSDVYADRRIPTELLNDAELVGECLSGALYWNDFISLAKQCGFADPRLVEDRIIDIENNQMAEKLGNINFYSATFRLFKLAALEPACEDYGQAVIYKGTIPHNPHFFILDKHHAIEKGKVFTVCGNTWHMLKDTRFADHFEFIGDFDQHYGIFEGCGTTMPFDQHVHVHDDSAGCC